MPLDTGAAPSRPVAAADPPALHRLRPIQITLAADGALGSALRRARESLGLDAADIAQATRIRTAQIVALEADRFDGLPPWPFVLGFVRAYARALGVDPDEAAERLRSEAAVGPPALRAPVGLRHEDRPRRGRWLALAAIAFLVAVTAWNVSRRANAHRGRLQTAIEFAAPSPAGPPAPTRLGPPLPPPPEAAPPPTYTAPGVDPTPFGAPPAEADAARSVHSSQAVDAGPAFQPAGTIYGDAGAAPLLLQAKKSTPFVVRDRRGAVVFARQLAAGEAWRAPANGDLMVEVGNPTSIERFVDSRSRGVLSAPRVSLADLRR